MIKQLFVAVKSAWMKFAKAFGWFNTRLLLTLTYVILLAPAALVAALLRKDLLNKHLHQNTSYWVAKEKMEHTLERARRQF